MVVKHTGGVWDCRSPEMKIMWDGALVLVKEP